MPDNINENQLLLIIIAILLPPLAVGLKEGMGGHFILNIILCCFFWLPAILHAVWVVLKKPGPSM
jgi:uncharacterized membrane protein YqaE (UPF0057 family)